VINLANSTSKEEDVVVVDQAVVLVVGVVVTVATKAPIFADLVPHLTSFLAAVVDVEADLTEVLLLLEVPLVVVLVEVAAVDVEDVVDVVCWVVNYFSCLGSRYWGTTTPTFKQPYAHLYPTFWVYNTANEIQRFNFTILVLKISIDWALINISFSKVAAPLHELLTSLTRSSMHTCLRTLRPLKLGWMTILTST
jgi:hypothetical protein